MSGASIILHSKPQNRFVPSIALIVRVPKMPPLKFHRGSFRIQRSLAKLDLTAIWGKICLRYTDPILLDITVVLHSILC